MKRHILLAVLAWFFLISVACAIGTKDNEYNAEKMTTLTGEEILLNQREDVYTNQEFGFGFLVPKPMLDLVQQRLLEIYPISTTVTLMTFYSETLFEILASFDPSTSTEAEQNAIRNEIQKYAFDAAAILRLPPEAERMGESEFLADVQKNYSVVEEIARIDETIYYFAYNTDYSDVLLGDNEKAQLETVISELKDFTKNIFVFTPVLYEETSVVNPSSGLNSFEIQTLDGETVTEDIFKDYKLTMINIWATWCPPCIDEMPDLAELHGTRLPEGVNMITIATDTPASSDLAREIIDSVSGKFITLIPNVDLQPLLSTISAIPTTIFVDSEGNLVGDPLIGAPRGAGGSIVEGYLDMIDKLLSQL